MGFFDGLGSSAAALATKLGNTVAGVTKWVGDIAPAVVGIAQSAQALKLASQGKPPKASTGNVTPPGELPVAAKVEKVPESPGTSSSPSASGLQAALPIILIAGAVAVLAGSKR